MNYSECNQILKYLEKGNLDGLRSYVENRKEAHYYSEARKLLERYLKAKNAFYKTVDESLLLTDGYSAYFLDDSGLLTDRYLKNMSKQFTVSYLDVTTSIIRTAERFENAESFPVGKVETVDYNLYEVFSEDESFSKFFAKMHYNRAKIFLGENTEYRILKDKPVCLVRSPRGKGFVLGVNERD